VSPLSDRETQAQGGQKEQPMLEVDCSGFADLLCRALMIEEFGRGEVKIWVGTELDKAARGVPSRVRWDSEVWDWEQIGEADRWSQLGW
jgi:hypothetical protein